MHFNLTKHKSFYKHKQVWIAHSMFKTSTTVCSSKHNTFTFQLVYLLLWVGTWLVPLIPMITGNKTTGLQLVRNEMYNLIIQCSWHILRIPCLCFSTQFAPCFISPYLIRFKTQLHRFNRELFWVSLNLQLYFGCDVTSILYRNSTACSLTKRTFQSQDLQ